jgi:alkylhydroperoxidase family enzyme
MSEGDRSGVQQHPSETEPVTKEAVVTTFAVGRVSDQGMADVMKMTPDLMKPPRLGLDLEQRVAAGRVTPDGKR